MTSDVIAERKVSQPSTEQYKVKLPPGLKSILEDLTREAIRKQPKNLDVFFADYFTRKLEERARDIGANEFQNYIGPDDDDLERKNRDRRKESLRKIRRQRMSSGGRKRSQSRKKLADTPSYEDYDDPEENARFRRRGSKNRNNCECPYPEATAKAEKTTPVRVRQSKPIDAEEWREEWKHKPDTVEEPRKKSLQTAPTVKKNSKDLTPNRSTTAMKYSERVSVTANAPQIIPQKSPTKITAAPELPAAKRKSLPETELSDESFSGELEDDSENTDV